RPATFSWESPKAAPTVIGITTIFVKIKKSHWSPASQSPGLNNHFNFIPSLSLLDNCSAVLPLLHLHLVSIIVTQKSLRDRLYEVTYFTGMDKSYIIK